MYCSANPWSGSDMQLVSAVVTHFKAIPFSSDPFMALIYSYPKTPRNHFLSICLARKKRKFPLFTSSDFILAAPRSILMCPEMDAARESWAILTHATWQIVTHAFNQSRETTFCCNISSCKRAKRNRGWGKLLLLSSGNRLHKLAEKELCTNNY